MLSTAKIGTGSWRYYSNQVQHGACEYFLGVGEAPGRWTGRGLHALGLDANAVVEERELEALFGRAMHPASREQLGRAWRADGVTGYDLCFSAPKSVSVLWAVGVDTVPSQVGAAHRAAVTAALGYLDTHAAFSRTGTDGHTQVGTDGFTAAVFPHRTSRAGEPQLHSHALVVNKVRCPDEAWRAIDGHEIYAHKKSAGVVYQAVLRNELTRRLGVGWTQVSKDGQAEIAGIPTELAAAWSTRTGQVTTEAGPLIAAYEIELGRPLISAERTAVQKVAVLKTRPGKDPVDIVALTDRWHQQAAALGWDGLGVQRSVDAAARSLPGTDDLVAQLDRAAVDAVAAAGGRRAVFTRSDLVAEVAARLPNGGFDADLVVALVEQLTDQALTASEAVTLRSQTDGPLRSSDARYASRTTVDRELEIVGFAEHGRRAGAGVCDVRVVIQATRDAGLDLTQAGAVADMTQNGDQVSVLVAPAGTGKTTTLAAATAAWQRSGYQVIGLAPSARAAKALGDATGLRADTVAKFLHEHTGWPDPRYRLARGGVILVDEASMLGTADLHALTGIVAQAGGKLELVGDPAQIAAIDTAGGMLAALANRLGAPSLAEVHRFSHHWERAASLQLRRGDPHCLTAYLDHDRVHTVTGAADPYEAILTDYEQLTGGNRRVLLLARTHDDVDALNLRARAAAIQTDEVTGALLLTAGDHEWRVGDRLRATRNNRHIPVGHDHLRNGDSFTVTGHSPPGLLVHRTDQPGDTATLPVDYLAEHARYGWASTIDAAQGATVDHALLLARPGLDRTRLYVGMTRGRDTNHLYLAPAAETDGAGHNPRTADANPTARLHAMLATSDETVAAHTRLTTPAAPIAPRSQLLPSAPPRWPEPDRTPLARAIEYPHDRSQGRGR